MAAGLNPQNIVRNGKLYTWQPDTQPLDDYVSYTGVDRNEAARVLGIDLNAIGRPGEGPGSYVEATYANPNGLSPLKAIGLLAGAGTPAGAINFASFMHPDQDWLKYAALAAGGYEALGGGYGLPGGRPLGMGSRGVAGGANAAPGGATAAGGAATTAAGGGGMGLNLDWLDRGLQIFDTVGDVIGGIEGARANNRGVQAEYNLDWDTRNAQRAQAQAQQILADVAQRKYADEANNLAQRQRQAAAFIRAPNAVTTRPGTVPTVTSNYGPEMVPNREALADDLERQAMIRILNPVRPGNGSDTMPAMDPLAPVTRSDLDGGTLDKILSGISMGGSIAGALDEILNYSSRNRGQQPAVEGENAYNRDLMFRPSSGGAFSGLTIPRISASTGDVVGENAYNRNLMFDYSGAGPFSGLTIPPAPTPFQLPVQTTARRPSVPPMGPTGRSYYPSF